MPQRLLAKAVDGGDAELVETGYGIEEMAPLLLGATRTCGGPHDVDEPLRCVGEIGIGKQRLRCDAKHGPRAIAKFGDRGSGERDHQQLIGGDAAFGDVAHDERSECIGFAGAGAGFERCAPSG